MKSLLVSVCFLLQFSNAIRQLLNSNRHVIDDLQKRKVRSLMSTGTKSKMTPSSKTKWASSKGSMNVVKKKKQKSKSSSMNMKSFKGKGAKGQAKGKMGTSKGTEMPTLADIVADNKELSTLQFAIEAVDVEEIFATQSPLTVLAPINAAFDIFKDAYPDLYDVLFTPPWELHLLDLLFSHVVEGDALVSDSLTNGQLLPSVGGQDIAVKKTDSSLCFTPSLEDESCAVDTDIMATNGVAHLVDGVISPTWVYYSIYSASVGVLPTLAGLIECAGLQDVFESEIGFTVFAPSEEALAELDGETLCSTPDDLADILSYHVLGKVLPSTQIPEGTSYFKTLQGSDLTLIYTNPGTETASLSVDGALAVAIDVGANNGVIHVIDEVLSIPQHTTSAYAKKGKGPDKKGKSSQKGVRK